MKRKLLAGILTLTALLGASAYVVGCGTSSGNGVGGAVITIKGTAQ